jgi:hypothetical protein
LINNYEIKIWNGLLMANWNLVGCCVMKRHSMKENIIKYKNINMATTSNFFKRCVFYEQKLNCIFVAYVGQTCIHIL